MTFFEDCSVLVHLPLVGDYRIPILSVLTTVTRLFVNFVLTTVLNYFFREHLATVLSAVYCALLFETSLTFNRYSVRIAVRYAVATHLCSYSSIFFSYPLIYNAISCQLPEALSGLVIPILPTVSNFLIFNLVKRCV